MRKKTFALCVVLLLVASFFSALLVMKHQTNYAHAVSGTLAQDTFHRANQKFWGTASDGQTWGGDANTIAVFSIKGNTGQIANGNNSYSAVLGPSITNAEVLVSGSMSVFSKSNIGAVLRWTDGKDWYKAYIDGTNLVIQKKVHGVGTTLGTTSFAAGAGTSYTIRFRVVGSTLYAKVWPTSGTEPAGWMLQLTDSTLTSGQCGVHVSLPIGVTATFTSFLATSQ